MLSAAHTERYQDGSSKSRIFWHMSVMETRPKFVDQDHTVRDLDQGIGNPREIF